MPVAQADTAEAPERTENEYAHLIELFRERDRLPVDDPRREVLRSCLLYTSPSPRDRS